MDWKCKRSSLKSVVRKIDELVSRIKFHRKMGKIPIVQIYLKTLKKKITEKKKYVYIYDVCGKNK